MKHQQNNDAPVFQRLSKQDSSGFEFSFLHLDRVVYHRLENTIYLQLNLSYRGIEGIKPLPRALAQTETQIVLFRNWFQFFQSISYEYNFYVITYTYTHTHIYIYNIYIM